MANIEGVPAATTVTLEDALAEFFRASRRARGRAAQRADAGELSLAQFQLVEPLLEGPLPGARLAEHAAVSAPTASRVLDGLITRGVVERVPDPADRRAVPLRLTAAGRRAAQRKQAVIGEARSRMAAAVDPADRPAVAAALVRLAGVLEEL